MNLPLWIICSITVSCLTIALAGENASSKKKNPKNQLKDDLTIDDEDAEGSGFGESRYDLESSGSGYGPDDEDAEHGIGPFVNIHSKSGQVRGNDQTIPVPGSTIKSVSLSSSSSSTPLPKHIAEPIPGFDENSRENPVDTASKENKNILSNNNLDRDETENRALIPKKAEGETIYHNRHPDDKNDEDNKLESNGVYKVNTPDRDRATSFFAQPGILAAVIGGAVVGLLCAILVVMFIVYRMRKKDEGSYPLEEMKRCPASNPYMKPNHREFFA